MRICGVELKGSEAILAGPTLQNVHSPDERLEVATVQKVYDLIVAALGQIK